MQSRLIRILFVKEKIAVKLKIKDKEWNICNAITDGQMVKGIAYGTED